MTGNVIADAIAGSPSYTGKRLRTLFGALMSKQTTRPLGGGTGVTAGTPSNIVTATSAAWTVQPHSGMLDVSAVTDGPTPYSFDAAVTGSMAAADSTNPRIDLLCVTHNDQTENDGTTTSPAPVLTYVQGTATQNPVPPVVPTRSFALAQFNIPKVNNGSPSVVFVAPFAVAAGGVLPVNGAAQYPTAPYVGQYIDDITGPGMLRWDGANWQPRQAGTLLGDATNGPVIALSNNNTPYVAGPQVSFTLPVRRRVRIVVNTTFSAASSSASGSRYVSAPAYSVGSPTTASAATVAGPNTNVVYPGSGTYENCVAEGTVLLPAGTYTAHALAFRVGGNAADQVIAQSYCAVYDAGPT